MKHFDYIQGLNVAVGKSSYDIINHIYEGGRWHTVSGSNSWQYCALSGKFTSTTWIPFSAFVERTSLRVKDGRIWKQFRYASIHDIEREIANGNTSAAEAKKLYFNTHNEGVYDVND